MKVGKIVNQIIPKEIEIGGARLLTINEAKLVKEEFRKYRTWWWLQTPGTLSSYVTYVRQGGYIDSNGYFAGHNYGAIRPALIISNLIEFNLGDKFTFGNKLFQIITSSLAFCLEDIGEGEFRKDWNHPDANSYLSSDIKKYIDDWFDEVIKIIKENENG